MKRQTYFESRVIIPRCKGKGTEILISWNELDPLSGGQWRMILGASRFCCLLFVSVTVYHHPAKQLSQLCPYVLYSLHVFPEEASSEIAYIFLLSLPCIYCDISMALWFCISVLDWLDILQVFPDTFRCSKWYSQSCSTSPHSGWIPGNVCLAQLLLPSHLTTVRMSVPW